MKTNEPRKSILELFATDAIDAPATITGGGFMRRRGGKGPRPGKGWGRRSRSSRSRSRSDT
jgi:hypothetical protein